MSDVESWSPVDESNTAAPPDGWPEFMMPSGVNNTGRMMMGAVRRMYDKNVNGTTVLPYLRLSGGTVTGATTFNAALTLATGGTAGNHATRKDYVDQRDTDWYNAAWSNITTWANNQDVAHYNNAVNYANTLDSNQRGYIDSLHNSQQADINNRVYKGGDTMWGNLTISTGGVSILNCGGVQLVANDGAGVRYLEFIAGAALTYRLSGGRTAVAHPGVGEQWVMEGACYANVSWCGGHGAYVDLSDASLKEQITPAPQGLAEILQLQPKMFIRKPRYEGQVQRQELGFVAQDVQAVMPLAIVEVNTEEGLLLGVASEAITAALVTAIKELDQRLTAGGL